MNAKNLIVEIKTSKLFMILVAMVSVVYIASSFMSDVYLYKEYQKTKNPPQVTTTPTLKKKIIKKDPKKEKYENSIIKQHIDNSLKAEAITKYMITNKADDKLIKLVPLIIELSDLYNIDPFRPTSIMIHETGFGKSNAMQNKNNVAGMNWTGAQKRKIGIKSNIHNLAVEKTTEASVTNLIMLLVDYKSGSKPLITLSQIQTRYAPISDKRNGLNGMNNNTWTKNTIKHYRNIEKIYLQLKGGDNDVNRMSEVLC